jgi:hypothetical protein
MKRNMYALFLLTAISCINPARGGLLVNTVADFSNASQGINGLEYGYYTSPDSSTGTFSTLGMVPSVEGWDGPEAFGTPELNQDNQHPGVDSLFPAVRRYTVGSGGEPSFSGLVQITGVFGGPIALGGGDVIGFITIDGTTVFSAPASGLNAVNFDFTAAVSPGSHIDFGIEANGSTLFDRTLYTATVSTVPDSGTSVLLMSLGLAALIFVQHVRGRRFPLFDAMKQAEERAQ